MNCDQAFDVMTSTRRASDRGLHDHLDGCPRCRVMRQTLEPALEMFSEDVELSSKSAHWESDADCTEIAARAARQLSSGEPVSRRGLFGLWGYAAAVVLGAGLIWCTIVRNPSTAEAPQVHRGDTMCLYLSPSRSRDVTAQKVTQSCVACHAVASQP